MMQIQAEEIPMKNNDGEKDNEGGHRLTRRAVLKAGLSLGALTSTGSFAAHAASPGNISQNSMEKERSVRMATWHDGFFFNDESLVFELIRVLAKALEHGADIGESLSTAFRIKQKEGDQQALLHAWYEEWRKLGQRIEKIGDECVAKGHKVSARDAYFRASEYYRSADFYLHGNPENPAILQLWDRMDSCFEKARKLSIPTFEAA
jgi:hypothetical protein